MDFNKTLNINKRFVLIMILVVGIVLISSYSYALFQVNFIKSNVVVLKSASNLNITTTIDSTNSDTFTLPANGNKTVTVHLTTDGITSAMAYKMYYELTGDGAFTVTSTETFTDDKIEGVMQPITKTGYDYKVTGKDIVLTFTNNSTNSLTIKLGAIGGFEKTGASLTTEEELLVNTELPVSQGGGNTPSGTPTMAEMCPNCKYFYSEGMDTELYLNDSTENDLAEFGAIYDSVEEVSIDSDVFLGYVVNSGFITNIYACGINNDIPFCIEGIMKDDERYDEVYTNNQRYLNYAFGENNCHYDASNVYYTCSDSINAELSESLDDALTVLTSNVNTCGFSGGFLCLS